MKLSEIPKDELELMGYDDIALYVLQESNKKMKLVDIFKKVCKVLELPNEYVESHLVDFFELMSINKKFTMLENGYWDLQTRHKPEIVIEDTDEEIEEIEPEEEIIEEDEEEEDIFYDNDDDETEDDVEDDLADLVVINGPEDEEASM